MPRPKKNCVDYFPHDADMRNHKKVKAIRSKFGPVGYGIWSMVLEYLAGSDGNVFAYTDMEFELMAGDFGVSATEIRDVVDYCISLEMLFNKDGFIHSESLDERLAPVYEKRGKAKELSKKQRRANGQYVSSNAESSGVSVTEIPQSKVKESKVKESKVKESKVKETINAAADESATPEKRAADFMNKVAAYVNEYDKRLLREFYDYWTEKNEGGRKMRFEMEKVFDVGRRLKTWAKNDNQKYGTAKNDRTNYLNNELVIIANHAAKTG